MRPALRYQMMWRRFLFMALGCLALSGCGQEEPPAAPAEPGKGSYVLGAPYQAGGTWYYPAADFSYDETGFATVYGADGNKSTTTNGDVFDPNIASGAHHTLALPSIVQVTNLDNGRSIQLRLNDRGPPVPNRILELSRRAAQLLGVDQSGTAKVRIRVLVTESIQAQSIAKHNGGGVAEDVPAPPAVPRGTLHEETLPPPGSDAQPQPVSKPPPPPRVAAEPPPAVPVEAVSLVPVRTNQQIFIQAGAFSNGDNARRMKSRLDPLGPVTVGLARINGVDVFRVRLGPIGSIGEADRLLSRAVGAGAADAKIVID
jgi:rare lipoprotein A